MVGIMISMVHSRGKLVKPEDVASGIFLGALVAITPCCDSVHTYASFIIGGVGAGVAIGVNILLPRLKIDDPVGATGVHAGASLRGLTAVGLFSDNSIPTTTASDDLLYGWLSFTWYSSFRHGHSDWLGYRVFGSILL